MTIKEINEIPIFKLGMYFRNLTEEEASLISLNPNLYELSDIYFKNMFNNLDEKYLINVLDNEANYDKLLNIILRPQEKNFFMNLNEEVFKKIVESNYAVKYHAELENIIKSFPKKQYDHFIKSSINLKNVMSPLDTDEILAKFNLDEKDNIVSYFENKVKNGLVNQAIINKFNNYSEFLIYTKFNLLINVKEIENKIDINDHFTLDIEFLKNIPEGKINKIIGMLKEKDTSTPDSLIFEVAIKLYCCFGFDNSKKIIDGKFFDVTEQAIQRINDYDFKIKRANFRQKNPEAFYQHSMVDRILKGDKKAYDAIFYLKSEEERLDIIEAMRDIILKDENVKENARKIIKELIDDREQSLKLENRNKLKSILMNHQNNQKIGFKLYNMLIGVDINKVLTYNSSSLEKINRILLGNGKKDNDCLFRLMYLGYSNGIVLEDVVNNINVIDIIASEENIALDNIIGLANILKINRFNIQPNATDLSLNTITRIVNSRHYCDIDEQELIKKMFELHVLRKQKVMSNIPTVSGEYKNIKYEVAPFDAEYLMAAGIDGECCFKIGGPGEELFRYCLTDKSGVIIYITVDDKVFMCPTVRSGNGIHVNSIEPEVKEELREHVTKALKECLSKIIEKSIVHEEHEYNIEYATLTDMHLNNKKPLDDATYIEIEKDIPIDKDCYADYNKKGINNYIIASSSTYQEPKYYVSNDQFLQARPELYEFKKHDQYDAAIFNVINSIAYTSIDYKEISEKEKASLKRRFLGFTCDYFEYIIGSKDWFIGIDENCNLVGFLLPYDERAKAEYIKYHNKIASSLKKGDEDGKYRKNI